uniref:Uncharacterized protein n=1 Tax=Arundo donax TaxID=35708 RepID=A0A0A9CD51_ARUDO
MEEKNKVTFFGSTDLRWLDTATHSQAEEVELHD